MLKSRLPAQDSLYLQRAVASSCQEYFEDEILVQFAGKCE